MELIPAKTIVTKNKDTSWFGSDYNMNLYRGCSHGCIYCDSRSSCYHVDDFENVKAKENALLIVRDDLRRKVKKGVVGTGAMSDPYNPHEAEMELTMHSLELIGAFGFGVSMLTKSTGILRDILLYQVIAEQSPVNCMLTITTCDDTLSKKLEPGVPPSSERFKAVKELADAGLYTGVVMTPVLPFLEDTKENILGMIELARESKARFIYPMFGVTLRDRQRDYFYSSLDRIFPGENLRQQYEKRYGDRYFCSSPKARSLYSLFEKECVKAGILYKMPDIIHSYKKNYQYEQLTLF
ncbi:SPL family radical SAM protein [Clostridium transplantifaecale]|uniref:SPL family radical SAM protein n=1 Tax=Clostridium transplantifaecale TaxID=2479838 RepID=UPI000F62EFA6|nr:radical SAM protein [Clostridium transplantifaecale]